MGRAFWAEETAAAETGTEVWIVEQAWSEQLGRDERGRRSRWGVEEEEGWGHKKYPGTSYVEETGQVENLRPTADRSVWSGALVQQY